MKQESFLLRLLDKINGLGTDAILILIVCSVCFFGTLTIVGGMAVCYYAPPDPNPAPHAQPKSPAMEALIRELRYCNDAELKKHYTQKIMELEERENSRRQIIINQVAPVSSEH